MPKLIYTVVTTHVVEEEVDGLRVTSTVRTEDGAFKLQYDCTEAFAALSTDYLKSVIENDWQELKDYCCLTRPYKDTRLSELYAYIEASYEGYEVVDYSVKVDEKSAVAWLVENKPEVVSGEDFWQEVLGTEVFD